MAKKLKDLAKLVGGEILGNPDLSVKDVSPISSAKPGDVIFAFDARALSSAEKSQASAIVAPLNSKPKKPSILVKNPRLAMAKILAQFYPATPAKGGIHKTAVISESAKVGTNSIISPFVFIGEKTEIGKNCVVHPNVTIYDHVKIGDNVIIHSGAVIGVDGFGFEQEAGRHVKIPQIGGVLIEDDVEIYSNATIASGTIDPTIIKRGSKIDCLCHIAHNCSVGEDCAITAQVAMSGSSTLKDRVYVGGQSAVNNRVTVGEGTIIMAKSGVTKDVPPNSVVSGFPAQDHKKELEIQAIMRRLPELIKKLLK
jgi:UDP-3-O-[3-hydroxymyristoyl] glucosamine N-acyltransferase